MKKLLIIALALLFCGTVYACNKKPATTIDTEPQPQPFEPYVDESGKLNVWVQAEEDMF